MVSNYAAEAAEFLSKPSRAIDFDGRIFLSKLAERFAKCEHFALPEDGRVLGSGIDGVRGMELRLPYKEMTFEYRHSKEKIEAAGAMAMKCGLLSIMTMTLA